MQQRIDIVEREINNDVKFDRIGIFHILNDDSMQLIPIFCEISFHFESIEHNIHMSYPLQQQTKDANISHQMIASKAFSINLLTPSV